VDNTGGCHPIQGARCHDLKVLVYSGASLEVSGVSGRTAAIQDSTNFAQKSGRILGIVVSVTGRPYILLARLAAYTSLRLLSSNVHCYKYQREPKRTQLPNKEIV
jgi:hypothetical protein